MHSEPAPTITGDPSRRDASQAPTLQGVWAALLPPLLSARAELLLVKDLHTQQTVFVNEAMAAFIGRPQAAILGHGDADVFDATLAATLRAAEQTALAQGAPISSEHRFDWAGARRDFSVLRAVSAPDDAGRRYLCSVWTDQAPQRQRDAQLQQALQQIEQQQQANELLRRELSDQALRDPDSGLYRRAHFDDQLRREVDLSTREHREFAIVFIDIDPPGARLRELGAGGQRAVLEAVGRLLRSGTRAMDASCRFGERRFAVLLSGVGLATAHSRMEGLRRKCAAQIVMLEGRELSFTVAMGVASFPHTALSQESLTQACETALAEAQRRGGNQVTLAAIEFDPA